MPGSIVYSVFAEVAEGKVDGALLVPQADHVEGVRHGLGRREKQPESLPYL
jgi:hypothetical protein